MSIDSFEKDLMNKLSYKASSKVSADAVLFKAFKFFDLNGVGFVPKNEFFRTMAKVGVVLDNQQDITDIFNYYDKGKKGKIFYSDFIDEVLFRNTSQFETPSRPSTSAADERSVKSSVRQQPEPRPKTTQKQNNERLANPVEILNCIRARLRQEGVISLLNLAVNMKNLDKDRTHHLSLTKFGLVFNYLTTDQIQILIGPFNQTGSSEVNYAEIAYHLRGKQSQRVQKFLSRLFNNYDSRGEGEIMLDELTQRWEGSKRNCEDFCQAVKLYCKFQGIDDGVFTQDDFLDFFGFLQFYFESDQEFENYVSNTQPERSVQSSKQSRREYSAVEDNQSLYSKLSKPSNYDFNKKEAQMPANTSPKYQNQDQMSQYFSYQEKASRKSMRSKAQSYLTNQSSNIKNIIVRIKNSLANKGNMRFLILEKALRGVDFDQDSLISLQELKKVVKDLRIGISDVESQILFQNFDLNGVGLMSYPQLVFHVRGQVPQHRLKLINRIWERVMDTQTTTSFTKLKSIFQPRAHPDIKIAKRHQEDIYKQFIDTILLLQDLNGVRSEEVDKETFIQYLENVSASTPDDNFFDIAMIGLWKLSNQNKIQEHYAGSKKKFDTGKNSYLQDFHKSSVVGGSSSDHAPFGTFKGPVNYTTQHRAAYEI